MNIYSYNNGNVNLVKLKCEDVAYASTMRNCIAGEH